jgi:hypothetical protein
LSDRVLLFLEKEAKSVVLLRRRFVDSHLGKVDEIKLSDRVLLFLEKEAKSVVLLRRRFGGSNLGEADETKLSDNVLLSVEKRSKKRCSVSQKVCWPNSRRSRPRGSGGVPPAKVYVKPLSSFPEKKQKR